MRKIALGIGCLILLVSGAFAQNNPPLPPIDQVTVAQISDIHIGLKRSPHAADNLKTAVNMINARHPDVVIVSGDIGETAPDWDQAKFILQMLKPPLHYAPGNHDIRKGNVDAYIKEFGPDYYAFDVKNVKFVVIDSQLLGNYETFDAKTPPPLPPQTEKESQTMLAWLTGLQGKGKVVIGIQHIPVFHDGSSSDPKPYWVVSDPYRSREMQALKQLGIKDMLVGHWHYARTFNQGGINWHVAPATSYSLGSGPLGFAIHTISANGDVRTDVVALTP
jgi:3',5'-cyclic AMP phosphodiesterase CpdA